MDKVNGTEQPTKHVDADRPVLMNAIHELAEFRRRFAYLPELAGVVGEIDRLATPDQRRLQPVLRIALALIEEHGFSREAAVGRAVQQYRDITREEVLVALRLRNRVAAAAE